HRALLLAGARLCGAHLSGRLQELAGFAFRGRQARRRGRHPALLVCVHPSPEADHPLRFRRHADFRLQCLCAGFRACFRLARGAWPAGAGARARHAGKQLPQLSCRLCSFGSRGSPGDCAVAHPRTVRPSAREGAGMTAVSATNEASIAAKGQVSARERLTNLAIDVFLFAFSLLMILPLVFLVSNAFKTPQELLAWPPTII